MKKSVAIGTLVFAFAATVGSAVSMCAYDGLIFVSNHKYLANERNPAAIRKVFDYSHFDGEPLKVRSLKRLISDAQVIAQQSQVGIELGHFVTKGEGGRGQLACDYYNRVTLKFEGEGVFEGGEKPVMTVEAPCQISADINRIETIWIPHLRLMAENKQPAASIEASFPDQSGVQFKFDNMTSVWPKEWTLISVRLYSDAVSGREVMMGKSDITEIIEKPLTLHF
jgi:hypothetical protein